jgi:hypothetical protein
MNTLTVPSIRSPALASLALASGVFLAAFGCFLIFEVVPAWGAGVFLLGCVLAMGLLAFSRRRGRLVPAYIPVAAVGLAWGILWIDLSAWTLSIGAFLFTTAGLDLIKRGWETPLGTEAIWKRVKAFSLFFSVFFVSVPFWGALNPPAGELRDGAGESGREAAPAVMPAEDWDPVSADSSAVMNTEHEGYPDSLMALDGTVGQP